MAIKTKTNTPVNITVSQAEVILSIIIGNAQIGGSQVKFQNEAAILIKGEVKGFSLGPGTGLKNKTLEIITNVLDVNPGTNNIVITHQFANGVPDKTVSGGTVDNAGDIFSLISTYHFI